jgi:DNA-binding XRE family transcriptional regulator
MPDLALSLAGVSEAKVDVRIPRASKVKSAARMNSPSKSRTHIRKKETPSSPKPFSDAHYYTSSVKLFHTNDSGPAFLTGMAFVPMPANAPIPGFVCKAARLLLGQTQEWLSEVSNVSRKTLFDFETGEIKPKIAINNRLRAQLEKAGASFVSGESVIGVVVFTQPSNTKSSIPRRRPR